MQSYCLYCLETNFPLQVEESNNIQLPGATSKLLQGVIFGGFFSVAA
jgi:hypothetical protein